MSKKSSNFAGKLKSNMEEKDYMEPEFDEMDEWEEDIEGQEEHGDLLTISEMIELMQQEPYKLDKDEQYQPELLLDDQTGKYYTDYFKSQYEDHILLSHILAELCVEHKGDLDWGRVTDGYDTAILAKIVGLYYSPLAWSQVPTSLTDRYIIVGKFAKEVEVDRPGRMELIDLLLNEAREKRAVWFVDHIPSRGIAKWENFLTNYPRADLLKALSPNSDYYFHLSNVSVSWLRENLEYVVAYRGIKKAQEVLDRLRKEWNHLVKLKLCNFDKMTNEEIEELREYVFDTVNYQMDLWKIEAGEDEETENKSEQGELEAPKVCRYICAEKIKETGARTVVEYTQMLGDACSDAPTLGNMLVQGRRLGYLNFHGDGKSAIYKHLKECYPGKIKFGYPNFTQYFD